VRTRGARRGTVITSLVGSRSEDIRDRERRYIFAMLFRVVCLVGAVLIFSGPLQIAAIAIAIIMPWLAVLFANQPRPGPPTPALEIDEARQRDRSLTTGRPHHVIDMD
jgi:predicted MFS family arabinose efflux permease